jgi:hypothetical protein
VKAVQLFCVSMWNIRRAKEIYRGNQAAIDFVPVAVQQSPLKSQFGLQRTITTATNVSSTTYASASIVLRDANRHLTRLGGYAGDAAGQQACWPVAVSSSPHLLGFSKYYDSETHLDHLRWLGALEEF